MRGSGHLIEMDRAKHLAAPGALGNSPGGVSSISGMSPDFPPHPMGHRPAPPINPSTPWTLGSSDGKFAANSFISRSLSSVPPPSVDHMGWQSAPRSLPQHSFVDSSIVNSPAPPLLVVPQQQQQHHSGLQGGGAAIGFAGEATQANNNSTTTSNNNNNNSTTSNSGASNNLALNSQQSLYQERIFHQPSTSVEAVLAAACEVIGFDIAEVWLRTGPKTHQLTNSHLRPTALEDSMRKELVAVYYGSKSSDRTHRLSPALCKRAKEANDVVWISAYTQHGAETLRCSISNVRTAVAVPVCHEASHTNLTVIFFSLRRIPMRTAAVAFLVHMSLAVAIAAVNNLIDESDRPMNKEGPTDPVVGEQTFSRSEHAPLHPRNNAILHQRVQRVSVAGAQLDLQWRQLHNVEYLTDGGNSWIHTAVYNAKPVVVKTLKPECQDVALAINEIESELVVHSRLNHPNIVNLIGAGTTTKGVRFVVLERLDGGTLTQQLGYDTRIRDRRRRFWGRKKMSFLEILRCARSIAEAMMYCHEEAIPGSMVLHRDLKPDNIGFTLDGTVKLLDFGLARIVENASVHSKEAYAMSGETGSLRYMAPEVADGLPYNHKADVYSFGMILWELNAGKKPFDGLNRELFYERVVHGGERPSLNTKWPDPMKRLMTSCWSVEIESRPNFREIVRKIDEIAESEKVDGSVSKKAGKTFRRISGMIDRHSTWF